MGLFFSFAHNLVYMTWKSNFSLPDPLHSFLFGRDFFLIEKTPPPGAFLL